MSDKVIPEVLAESQAGELVFPEVVRRLLEAGVESYFCDLARGTETLYIGDGQTHLEKMTLPRSPVAEGFSSSELVAAIRRAQSDPIRYPEFMKRSSAAGIIAYWAFLTGRKVITSAAKVSSTLRNFRMRSLKASAEVECRVRLGGVKVQTVGGALTARVGRTKYPRGPHVERKFQIEGAPVKMRPALSSTLLVLALCFFCGAAWGQQGPGPGALPSTAMPSVLEVPHEAQPSDHFDAGAATNAYLAQIPAEARARSDAYFEGGYWLVLWDFLYGAIVAVLLLQLRWSAGMRNLAERITRLGPLQTLIYWTEYLVVSTILGFPLTVYEGYSREHKYGLATQTFGPWLSDQFKGLLIGIILGGIIVTLLFGVVRRLPNTWSIWGSLVSILFVIFTVMITPVYIMPVFNKTVPLDDPRVTGPILSMAHANGIDADKVYEVDASRQTTRMSANVSGIGSTMRITLNDNLLKRGSREEIQFVMGHEMVITFCITLPRTCFSCWW